MTATELAQQFLDDWRTVFAANTKCNETQQRLIELCKLDGETRKVIVIGKTAVYVEPPVSHNPQWTVSIGSPPEVIGEAT